MLNLVLRWHPSSQLKSEGSEPEFEEEPSPLREGIGLGYAVVPWKRRSGYVTQALRDTLKDAQGVGLRHVEITTSHDNLASQRVIEANGGEFVEEFTTPAALGGHREIRYRIHLTHSATL